MLKDSHYIVTGASSGIGLAITKMLLEEDARVAGVSRRVGNLSLGKNFRPFPMDFNLTSSLEAEMQVMLRTADDWQGVICAAGIGRFAYLEQLSFAQMQAMMKVNFLAHALLIKLALPYLKRHEFGRVIIIGSEAALEGTKNGTLYCASKFALRGFAQALRQECAKSGVQVSLINPGMVRTPFFDELDFSPGSAEENAIEANDVAQVVKLILGSRQGTNFDEVNLSPLKHVIDFKS